MIYNIRLFVISGIIRALWSKPSKVFIDFLKRMSISPEKEDSEEVRRLEPLKMARKALKRRPEQP